MARGTGYMIQGYDVKGYPFTEDTTTTLKEALKCFRSQVKEAKENYYGDNVAEIHVWSMIDYIPQTQYDSIYSWHRNPIE